jgi:hypothetical protein
MEQYQELNGTTVPGAKWNSTWICLGKSRALNVTTPELNGTETVPGG